MQTNPTLIHAIRAWDAAAGEDTLCGIPHNAPVHVQRSHTHEYATCPACRAHADFAADRNEAPWPLPTTIAESTAHLRRLNERHTGGAA